MSKPPLFRLSYKNGDVNYGKQKINNNAFNFVSIRSFTSCRKNYRNRNEIKGIFNMENKNDWGGSRQGAGRKKGTLNKGEHKSGRIVITCLESEEAKIKELATQSGKSVSRFIVDTILQN